MGRSRKPAGESRYSKAEVDAIRQELAKFPVFMTRAQFAQTIGVSYETTRVWQRTGRFPKPDRRIGNTDRWLKRRVLLYLLDKNSTQPQPQECAAP